MKLSFPCYDILYNDLSKRLAINTQLDGAIALDHKIIEAVATHFSTKTLNSEEIYSNAYNVITTHNCGFWGCKGKFGFSWNPTALSGAISQVLISIGKPPQIDLIFEMKK